MSQYFTPSELSKYSVTKALAHLATHFQNQNALDKIPGIEGEVQQTLKARLRDQSEIITSGLLIPIAALKTLSATTFTGGGALAGSAQPTGIIPALRNRSMVAALGAQIFDNLKGSTIPLPVGTGLVEAQWCAVGSGPAPSEPTLGRTQLSLRRCSAVTHLTRELIVQSSVGVESFVSNELLSAVGLALDRAALAGVGGVEPLGIINQPIGLNAVTFGATATRGKVVEFQAGVADDNGSSGALGYLTTPTTAAKWMDTPEVSGHARWLWEGNINQGMVAGLPSFSTKQVPGHRVIYGAWDSAIIGLWGDAIEITANPYTYASQGLVQYVVHLLGDVAFPQPERFSVSTDAGNQ